LRSEGGSVALSMLLSSSLSMAGHTGAVSP
jgi:hypothetical protein